MEKEKAKSLCSGPSAAEEKTQCPCVEEEEQADVPSRGNEAQEEVQSREEMLLVKKAPFR